MKKLNPLGAEGSALLCCIPACDLGPPFPHLQNGSGDNTSQGLYNRTCKGVCWAPDEAALSPFTDFCPQAWEDKEPRTTWPPVSGARGGAVWAEQVGDGSCTNHNSSTEGYRSRYEELGGFGGETHFPRLQ